MERKERCKAHRQTRNNQDSSRPLCDKLNLRQGHSKSTHCGFCDKDGKIDLQNNHQSNPKNQNDSSCLSNTGNWDSDYNQDSTCSSRGNDSKSNHQNNLRNHNISK